MVRKGIKFSAEHRKKLSESHKGVKLSEYHRKRISEGHKGLDCYWLKGRKASKETRKKMSDARKGENAYQWISDRSLLKKQNRRNDPLYREWRRQVWERDNWKCRINNQDCDGRIIAHHILPWRDFPELRYEVNNGITLCQFHHPRKRIDEQKLIPVFPQMTNEQLEEVKTI